MRKGIRMAAFIIYTAFIPIALLISLVMLIMQAIFLDVKVKNVIKNFVAEFKNDSGMFDQLREVIFKEEAGL